MFVNFVFVWLVYVHMFMSMCTYVHMQVKTRS